MSIAAIYLEVIETAKQKGYNPECVVDLVNENVTFYHNPELGRFIDLTLIQAWLRDEKSISVVVSDQYVTQDYFVQVRFLFSKDSNFKYLYPSYDEALLNGINEALKLA
jgi:hypothetical protein